MSGTIIGRWFGPCGDIRRFVVLLIFALSRVILAASDTISYDFRKIDFREGIGDVSGLVDLGHANQTLATALVGVMGSAEQAQLDSVVRTAILEQINREFKSGGQEFKVQRNFFDKFGNRHMTLQQYQGDVQVLGGVVTFHLDRQNRIFRVTGKCAVCGYVKSCSSSCLAGKPRVRHGRNPKGP